MNHLFLAAEKQRPEGRVSCLCVFFLPRSFLVLRSRLVSSRRVSETENSRSGERPGTEYDLAAGGTKDCLAISSSNPWSPADSGRDLVLAL